MGQIKKLVKMKEFQITFGILLLPVMIIGLLIWPHFEEFIAPGDTVSVSELGIDGNVSFVYVEAGITRNYYEKISTLLAYEEDIEFSPLREEDFTFIDPYDDDFDIEMYDIDEDKEETIHNAVVHASAESHVYDDDVITEKVQNIIDHAWEYEGNSFGLMLAIGLVEELDGEDFSRYNTYTIAGTGTMEADQTVGSIDGIRQKLLTAESNFVDYFFLPKDKNYYADKSLSNQLKAEAVMKQEGLSLELVPVETLDEALLFLRNLP